MIGFNVKWKLSLSSILTIMVTSIIGIDLMLTACTPANMVATSTPVAVMTPTLPPSSAPTPTTTPTLAKSGDQPFEMVLTAEFEGVIVPQEQAAIFMQRLGLVEAEAYWTPSQDDIAKLEEQLGPYLQQAAGERGPDLWQKLSGYKRQYIGIVENGHRKIVVNFFCDIMGKDWKREPVGVLDGGECFFNVTYDVGTGVFSDLHIHGEA